jgi:hypothetical protein
MLAVYVLDWPMPARTAKNLSGLNGDCFSATAPSLVSALPPAQMRAACISNDGEQHAIRELLFTVSSLTKWQDDKSRLSSLSCDRVGARHVLQEKNHLALS